MNKSQRYSTMGLLAYPTSRPQPNFRPLRPASVPGPLPRPGNDNVPRPANDNAPIKPPRPSVGRIRLPSLNPWSVYGGNLLGEVAGVVSSPSLYYGPNWRMQARCPSPVVGYEYQSGYQCISVVANLSPPAVAAVQPARSSAYSAIGYLRIGFPDLSWRFGYNLQSRVGTTRTPKTIPNAWLSPEAQGVLAPRPYVMPFAQPSQAWNPVVAPMPWAHPRLNPWFSPTESPFHSYTEVVSPGRQPGVVPRTRPLTSQIGSPGPAPTVRGPRGPRWPKGQEVKLALRGAAGLVYGVFSTLTEYGDVVQALWDALPRSAQQHSSGSIRGMSQDVWNHFGEIDWFEAVANLGLNFVEDTIWGGAHGAWSAAANQGGWGGPVGKPFPMVP